MNGKPVTTDRVPHGVYGVPANSLIVYNSIEGWWVGHAIVQKGDTFTVLRFVGGARATVYGSWRVECEGFATEEEAMQYAVVTGRMISKWDALQGA